MKNCLIDVDPPVLWSGTIFGEPASKSNSPLLRVVGRRAIMAPSKKARNYRTNAVRQINFQIGKPREPITCRLVLVADIYYASERPDLDESLICDVLQVKGGAGVIQNDRQIRSKRIEHYIDKINPRAEIKLIARQ